MPSTNPGQSPVQILDIAGNAPDNVWLLGHPFLHWDGAGFTSYPQDTPRLLTGGYAAPDGGLWVSANSGHVLRR